MNTKSILASVAALALSLGTAACGGGEPEEADAERAGCAPRHFGDRRPAGPARGEGNPAAVYFTVDNDGDAQSHDPRRQCEGAGSAMLHQTRRMEPRAVDG